MKISTEIITKAALILPDIGGVYKDTQFNTTIKRLTNALTSSDPAYDNTRNLAFITPEYATICPFNIDSSLFLLQHSSFFALYDGSGKFIRDLFKHGVNASSEPRWANDPNIFIYIRGNELWFYDTTKDDSKRYYHFAEYQRISFKGEGEASFDGQHLAIVGLKGDREEVFVFDALTLKKGITLSLEAGSFNNVYITPKNNVLIGYNNPGTGRAHGIEMYDKDMHFLRQIAVAMGHMDVLLDAADNEVAVWASAGDAGENKNSVMLINLKDPKIRSRLLDLHWDLALHIGAARAHYVTISTYDPFKTSGWYPYEDEIIRIDINTGIVERICHHHSIALDRYVYTPKAACNREGNKIIFGSNYGIKEDYSDAYMVDLTNMPVPLVPKPDIKAEDVIFSLDMYNVRIENGTIILVRK